MPNHVLTEVPPPIGNGLILQKILHSQEDRLDFLRYVSGECHDSGHCLLEDVHHVEFSLFLPGRDGLNRAGRFFRRCPGRAASGNGKTRPEINRLLKKAPCVVARDSVTRNVYQIRLRPW